MKDERLHWRLSARDKKVITALAEYRGARVSDILYDAFINYILPDYRKHIGEEK